MRFLLIASLAVVLSGCTSAGDVEQLRDREWTLAWVEGFSSTPAGVRTPSLQFNSDGRLAGNTGCNTAGGAYSIDGDRLTIGPMITTKRACAADEGNQLERAYVRAVEGSTRFRIVAGQLELLSESGEVLARFR
jgi:heat shock protein HslJ